ncbi:MAG: hypothetical protein ACNA8P_08195 [Phycisphaerales bacterium]
MRSAILLRADLVIHRKPTVLVISCSLALVAAVVLAGLYSRHLRDANLARACDGFDYRFVYENYQLGTTLQGAKMVPVRIHAREIRGCVRIDSVTPGSDGSASVRGQIRLQRVTQDEKRVSLDSPPWQPLLGFEATYGYPREGKMRWEFWEPDGTRVDSSLYMVLRDLCAPFAESASPGVYRTRLETIEAGSGERHVFWRQGVSPIEEGATLPPGIVEGYRSSRVGGWYLQPGADTPDRIYFESHYASPNSPGRVSVYRLNAVAIDPLAPAVAEPTFDAPTSQ